MVRVVSQLDFMIWKNWKLKTTYDTIHAFGSTCSDPEANSLNDGFYGEAQAPYLNMLKWNISGILVVALRTQSVHVFPEARSKRPAESHWSPHHSCRPTEAVKLHIRSCRDPIDPTAR